MKTPLRQKALLRSFVRDDSGNVTIYSMLMTVLILTITGASVDIMRFEANRAIIQSTMDRAVLAATDLDQKQDAKTVFYDYLDKSPVSDLLTRVEVHQALNSRTVVATGESKLDTHFMRIYGIDDLTINAAATAEEKIANVEISLVLDVSASMSRNSRIGNAKDAATRFVDKVMTEDTNGVTTLNLVPFAGHVNPGNTLFDHFRAERPDIPEENTGNGDWENTDDHTGDGDSDVAGDGDLDNTPVFVDDGDYFPYWYNRSIWNVMLYFDTNGDEVYDRVHKIVDIPWNLRDFDAYLEGAVAYAVAQDPKIASTTMFLGASLKGWRRLRYYQVKGDENGISSDMGPTKNDGTVYDDTVIQYNKRGKPKKKPKNAKLVGKTSNFWNIDFNQWADSYVSPNTPPAPDPQPEPDPEPVPDPADDLTNINMPNSCVEIYDDEFNTLDMPKSKDYVPHFNMWGPYSNPWGAEHIIDFGWCPDEDTAIQYYSDDKDALMDFIDDLRMYDGTGLQYAMKYALAMLNPDNRDEVAVLIDEGIVAEKFRGRPMAWNDSETEKYIVLMSDGQITDQNRPTNPTNPRNNTQSLYNQGSSAYRSFSTYSNNVKNFKAQCDLAKQNGVTIFAVAFETTTTATTDLNYCASSDSHFFHVTGSEIREAFDTIARQINNLRLIQ